MKLKRRLQKFLPVNICIYVAVVTLLYPRHSTFILQRLVLNPVTHSLNKFIYIYFVPFKNFANTWKSFHPLHFRAKTPKLIKKSVWKSKCSFLKKSWSSKCVCESWTILLKSGGDSGWKILPFPHLVCTDIQLN